MNKERQLLRAQKTKYKEQLTSLCHYIRELKAQCSNCRTKKEHVKNDLMEAEHNAQYYESQIKVINKRIKEIAAKGK